MNDTGHNAASNHEEKAMRTATYETIPYQPGLTITNIDQLPRGRGVRYLEVIRSHVASEFIAKCWRRSPMPQTVVIDFKPTWDTVVATLETRRPGCMRV